MLRIVFRDGSTGWEENNLTDRNEPTEEEAYTSMNSYARTVVDRSLVNAVNRIDYFATDETVGSDEENHSELDEARSSTNDDDSYSMDTISDSDSHVTAIDQDRVAMYGELLASEILESAMQTGVTERLQLTEIIPLELESTDQGKKDTPRRAIDRASDCIFSAMKPNERSTHILENEPGDSNENQGKFGLSFLYTIGASHRTPEYSVHHRKSNKSLPLTRRSSTTTPSCRIRMSTMAKEETSHQSLFLP